MRFLPALVLAFLAGCSDCGSSGKNPDAGKPRRDAGPVDAGFDAAGPLAVNEGLVKRYEDEEVVDHVAKTVATEKALVLAAHPNGEPVATVTRDRKLVAIAEHDGFYLVTLAESDGRTLLGWIVKFAFEPMDAGAPGTRVTTQICTGQKLLVLQDGKTRCDFVCYRDLECRDDAKCEAAMELPASGEIQAEPTYTTVCTGGAPRVKDSGVPSLFGEQRLPSGACRPGTTEVKKLGPLCFMTCKGDENCPQDSTCKPYPGTTEKLCFAD